MSVQKQKSPFLLRLIACLFSTAVFLFFLVLCWDGPWNLKMILMFAGGSAVVCRFWLWAADINPSDWLL